MLGTLRRKRGRVWSSMVESRGGGVGRLGRTSKVTVRMLNQRELGAREHGGLRAQREPLPVASGKEKGPAGPEGPRGTTLPLAPQALNQHR